MVSRSYDQPDVFQTAYQRCKKISGSGTVPADSTQERWSRIKRGWYGGNTTPDFHRRLQKGELLPLNSYTRWDYEATRSPGRYWGTVIGPNPKYSYEDVGPRGAILGEETNTLSSAQLLLNRMTRKVNLVALQQKAYADIAPDLDLLTSMAEVGKTVSMILGIRKRALSLIRQALRGGFDTARAASKVWLEWRYGWRILGYDIQNFCDFWERPFRGEILMGFAGVSMEETSLQTQHTAGSLCQYDTDSVVTRTVNVKVRAAAKYTGRNANVLVSPVVTGWELIPLSFVGDWFVSVGDVLSAWTVIAQADSTNSSVGYKLEESSRAVATNPTLGTSSSATSPYGVYGEVNARGVLLHRRPLGSLTLVPQLRVELDPSRIADAIALLVGFNRAAGLRI